MNKPLLILALNSSLAFSQAPTHPVERFKKQIGYAPSKQKDGKKLANDATVYSLWMVGTWADLKSSPQFLQGWEIRSSYIGPGPESVLTSLQLTNNENNISVECYNYPTLELAERAFWAIPYSVNVSIPFTATKHKIGEISARYGKTAVWVKKDNYFLRIFHINSTVDPEVIAEWLVAFADTKLVSDIKPHLPVPSRIVMNPPSPRVGQELEICFEMPGGSTPGRYILRDSFDRDLDKFMDQFAAVGRDGLTREILTEVFRAKKAGKGVYKYIIIDRQTSLFHKGGVEIDVAP